MLLNKKFKFIIILVGSIILLLMGIFFYNKSVEKYESNKNTKNHIDFFYNTAKSLTPITDKVTTHKYHQMYGFFLIPFYSSKPNMKFLEIGLGCNMDYGPGGSFNLWKKLFPQADLWLADYDRDCVEKWKKNGKIKDVNILIGDQENKVDLDRWITETNGGNFDVIIDDGGHHQCQIFNSFKKLWPVLNPGGLYFIEDLQIADLEQYKIDSEKRCDIINMPNVLKEWMEQLLYNEYANEKKWKYILPENVAFISFQAESCVIGKTY